MYTVHIQCAVYTVYCALYSVHYRVHCAAHLYMYKCGVHVLISYIFMNIYLIYCKNVFIKSE